MTLVLTHLLLYFHRQASSGAATTQASVSENGIRAGLLAQDEGIQGISLMGAINQRDDDDEYVLILLVPFFIYFLF
jgi:hypothetical protein